MTVEPISSLQLYSEGGAGTRETIERLGMEDYADLLIALAQADLPLPKPPPPNAARVRGMAVLSELLRGQA